MDDWRPTATRGALVIRAELVNRVRAWFAEYAALEVETPALSAAAPTDPHIHSLRTAIAGLGHRWLQTSPEFPMKRLLAAGFGDCWQLARVFRDGEQGRLHNPEFTLLEWYRVGIDDRALIKEVDALVRAVLEGFRALGPTTTLSYADAFEQATGLPLQDADATACKSVLQSHGIELASNPDTPALQDLVMGAIVSPSLGRTGPVFVTDYPAEQAALARLRERGPLVAARFELFIDGMELANGYHELVDAAVQRARFAADNARRSTPMPVDENLLLALEAGLPDCSGVALGFDRLVMLATGAAAIDQVIAFPSGRA